MGQRLNISIEKNGAVLANGYYHWSAYTGSALALTEAVVDSYEEYKSKIKNDLLIAVTVLESTGAGFNDNELIAMADDSVYSGLKPKKAIDRNRGLISVTKAGIEETERYEEGRVTIDIGKDTIDFSVYNWYPKDDFEADYADWMEPGGYYADLKTVSDLDFADIPIEEFCAFKERIEGLKGGVIIPGDGVYLWIE